MSEYVGIDVGKEQVDICWLRDIVSGKKKTKRFNNQPEAFAEITHWLTKQTQVRPEKIIITLEATGVYHEALIYFLHDRHFQLIVSNPGKAKKFAQSIGLIHKTDKSDAMMLARYGYSQPSGITFWKPEPPEIRQLKAMMRRLEALEKDYQREKNRFEASKISDVCDRVLTSLVDMMTVIEMEIKALKLAIDDHISQYPALHKNKQLLLTIKGVGNVIAREMVYLFAAKSFTHAKQVAAYLGLIPTLNESGMCKGRTTLSKSGPARVRAKLYLASVAASTHNIDIKAQRERLLKRGKTKMQALCAAMRKLVQICFGVVKNQTEYKVQVS
jgi:transposase